MEKDINALEIAKEFDLKIKGKTTNKILSPGTLINHSKNSISWLKSLDYLNSFSSGYLIVSNKLQSFESTMPVTFLITKEKPRLVFARILKKYFNKENDNFTNCVSEHKKNKKIRIGDFVFIGKNVEIGDGTLIHPSVTIHSNTKIGKNCVIKTHVSLGTEGIGIEMDEDADTYVKFPQIGGVIIEDDVEIGPCSTVRRSALDNTIIKSGTKIGSLVNIGHNCVIGKNCMLTSQIVTTGSSVIGNNVVMGVNSSVKNLVRIGNGAVIGQGAVVVSNVPDNSTYVGNPAIDIREYKRWSKFKKKMLKKIH